MKQAGFGVAGASGLVASVFLTLREGLVAELAQLAHHLDGLGARRCRERAQVLLGVLGLAGHVEEGGAVQVRLGHGVERVTESVSVKSSLIFGKSLLMWR